MSRDEIIDVIENVVNSSNTTIKENELTEVREFLHQLKETASKELWVADNSETKWVELFNPDNKPIMQDDGIYKAEKRSFRVPRNWFPELTRESPKKIKIEYL